MRGGKLIRKGRGRRTRKNKNPRKNNK